MTIKDGVQRPRFPYPFIDPVAALPVGTPETINSAWAAADFPAKQEWADLYMELFSGAGKQTYLKRAARLSDYGWEPEDLERVCSNPRELAKLPKVDSLLPDADSVVKMEKEAEALAALVHEASMYYGNGSAMALDRRTHYVARLSGLGWNQTQLASLVGVSKQRVQALLKGWRKMHPKSRFPQG